MGFCKENIEEGKGLREPYLVISKVHHAQPTKPKRAATNFWPHTLFQNPVTPPSQVASVFPSLSLGRPLSFSGQTEYHRSNAVVSKTKSKKATQLPPG